MEKREERNKDIYIYIYKKEATCGDKLKANRARRVGSVLTRR